MDLVIFDIDGTLIRSNLVDSEGFIEAIVNVLGLANFETDWSTYQFVTDSGIAQELSQRHRDRPLSGSEMKAIEADLLGFLEAAHDQEFQQVDGAGDFLQSLLESPDHAVALATGANSSSALHKLERAGFPLDLPLATSSDAVVREHIMLQAMDRAAQRHGRAFEKITYVGDGSWDVIATENLGWNFIGIGPIMMADAAVNSAFSDYLTPSQVLAAL